MLFHRTSALTLGSLAVAGLMTLAAPGASAAGAGGYLGSGTISPGLTTVPTNQVVTLSGTLVYRGSSGSGTYSCFWDGSSSAPETVATGGGSVGGSCSASAGTFWLSGGYARVGTVMTISGSVTGSVSGVVLCDLDLASTGVTGTCTVR
jgi:hypothetical protein